MNVEQAFIKCADSKELVDIIKRYVQAEDEERKKINIVIPDSYDPFIKQDKKRKIAISSPHNGWVSIVESKGVNDISMLYEVSNELNTEVVLMAQYDSVGAWGYAVFDSGEVIHEFLSEEDEDIENEIQRIMDDKGIEEKLYLFSEVVRNDSWEIMKCYI